MIILFTRRNVASANIAKKLIVGHGFAASGAVPDEWERDGVRLIDTNAPTVLDVPTDYDTELILVLSTHKSRTPGRMLTAHVPGNWGEAKMGGEPKTLNTAHGTMLKRLIQGLDAANRKRNLGWPVSLEADHHGPTCDVPILFVEIGNDEGQWGDERAAEVVAEAVAEAVFGKTQNTEPETSLAAGGGKPETVFGVGGGHYQRDFTKLILETDYAIGHMAPKYAIDAMDEGMFRQAIEKNVGKVAKVLILKDETNSAQKEKIKSFAAKFGLETGLI